MRHASGRQVKVGMAATSITPDRSVQLIGQFHERISTHVRDEVTATALALESDASDGGSAIVVSCDLVCIPARVQDMVRDALRDRLGDFDPVRFFAAATHTHTAPCVPGILDYPDPPDGVMPMDEYVAFLVERMADAAVEAWTNRRPGGLSCVVGHAALGFNRRVIYNDGHAEMYGNTDRDDFLCMEGGEDHAVELMYLWGQDDELAGVVINPACPSQVVEGQSFVSADFWAAARTHLRGMYGPELQVLPLTSACGDQSPRDLVRRGRGEPDMRDEEGLDEMGRRIAEMVEREYPRAESDVCREVELRHVHETLRLPVRKPTPAELARANAAVSALEAENPAPGTGQWGQLMHWRNALRRLEGYSDTSTFDMELHVVRVGDAVICTNPFELFLDFGLRIKARSRARQTFVVQLACDAGGYVPTRRAVAGGSYGAMIWNGDVGPDGGDMLVDRTVQTIDTLFHG